jgi:glycosyltransferase involved in cell wall biosynthesis
VRLALVHDYLTQRGGAERVVVHLAGLFPDAPIYTSLFDPDSTFPEFRACDVRTSSLQGRVDPARFRSAVLRYPRAFAEFDLDEFDAIVVSSSAFAHHVRHRVALVYFHTPPRFLYDPGSYVASPGPAAMLRAGGALLRRRDRAAARRHRSYAANSYASASRVVSAYGVQPRVLYPPLAVDHLPRDVSPLPVQPRALVVSRLLPYKRVDIAIAACRVASVPLTIVGRGPDEERLRRLAEGTDVRFLGRVDDDALADLFAAHSVVLAPGCEDFGFAPLEANHAGRPVVAQGAGGALETVVPGVTGALVGGTDVASWVAALLDVVHREWDPFGLRASAARFSSETFDRAVLAWLDDVFSPANDG